MVDVPPAPEGEVTPAPAPKKRRRWLRRSLITLVALLVACEIAARLLGMGNCVLMQEDPQIEYLAKPDQDFHLLGRHIKYNHYSMRSDDFPVKKSTPNEFRVLLIGDSVINGGNYTSHEELASSILQRKLAEELHRPVVVGHISAGSWGPANEVGYLKRFGLFDADVVVIVISSHDLTDLPTFEHFVDILPGSRSRPYPLAIYCVWDRYIWPAISNRIMQGENPNPLSTTVSTDEIERGTQALVDLLRFSKSGGAKLVVAQHLEQKEQHGHLIAFHDIIEKKSLEEGAKVIQLGPIFLDAQNRGDDPYRDNVHPNVAGQRIMAQALLPVILDLAKTPQHSP